MADTKITDLTSITGANTASADVFPLVDVSDTTMAASGTNKKITKAELLTVFEAAGTAATAVAAHEADTTNVHGIADTSALETTTGSASKVSTHAALTSSVHGISAFGATLVDDASAAAARTTLGLSEVIVIPIGDETTAITTGNGKMTFRMPFALTVTAVRASLTTASSSGIPTFDINEGGTTILSTKLTVDANEKTSTTAATAAVISDTALADDAEITIDVDVAGTGAAGAKIYIIGTRP